MSSSSTFYERVTACAVIFLSSAWQKGKIMNNFSKGKYCLYKVASSVILMDIARALGSAAKA